MKAFIYKGELYIRAIPCKRLFNSTTVHEVVNRGDIFALRVSDQQLTIVPGKATVEHTSLNWQQRIEPAACAPLFAAGSKVQAFFEHAWVQGCVIEAAQPNSRGYCQVRTPGGDVLYVHVLNIKRVPA